MCVHFRLYVAGDAAPILSYASLAYDNELLLGKYNIQINVYMEVCKVNWNKQQNYRDT